MRAEPPPQSAATALQLGLDPSAGGGRGRGPQATGRRHSLTHPRGWVGWGRRGGRGPRTHQIVLGSESKSLERRGGKRGTSQTGLCWPSRQPLRRPGSISPKQIPRPLYCYKTFGGSRAPSTTCHTTCLSLRSLVLNPTLGGVLVLRHAIPSSLFPFSAQKIVLNFQNSAPTS